MKEKLGTFDTGSKNESNKLLSLYDTINLERKSLETDPEDYRGKTRIPDKEIDENIKVVEELMKKFNEEIAGLTEEQALMRYNGGIIETIFYQIIRDGFLFGKNIRIDVPSKYDDFVNGVDLIVTILPEESTDPKNPEQNERDGRTFGLAFDFSSKASDACEKVSKMMRKIVEEGRMPIVKYGKTLNGEPDCWMPVAKVIIGLERDTMDDLSSSITESAAKDDREEMDEVINQSFAQHRIKDIVNDQILNQLIAYKNISYAFGDYTKEEAPKLQKEDLAKRDQQKRIGGMYNRAYHLFSDVLKRNGFDPEKAHVARSHDKIASAIYSMIGGMADSHKRPTIAECFAKFYSK